MEHLKLCVIDEILETDIIDKLLPSHLPIKHIANPHTLSLAPVTHGTVCTALLAESVQTSGITEQVYVTHVSISDKAERRSYSALLQALDYCIENHVDIVSMSVGIQNRTDLRGMFERIDKLDKTLIVAAASNSFELTYPASLPGVLGVRRAVENTKAMFSKRVFPPDGIELIANLPYTEVLRKLEDSYDKLYYGSNSALPPQIAAKIAAAALKHEVRLTKEFALDFLTGNNLYRDGDEYALPYPVLVDEDEKIPIILLPHENDDILVKKVMDLQSEFEKHEYSCCIISDAF